MTKRFTISVPDEVGAVLEHQDNVSAYLAGLIRRDQARQMTREALAAAGIDMDAIPAGRIQHWRERLRAPMPASESVADRAWAERFAG